MMVEGVVKGGVESDREVQNSDSGCFRRKASGESHEGGKGGEGVVWGLCRCSGAQYEEVTIHRKVEPS